ncbi:MAG: biotin/lipoyl-binding protein, partial [Myxococcota bacterium]|nr:biotin/lipoyl-binding protein [Myxococcota bacterium]
MASRSTIDADVARDLGLGSRGRARNTVWRIAAIALALVALVGIAWLVRTLVAGPATPAWITARAARGELTVTVDSTGAVEPVGAVEISAQVSGRIAEVHADYNDQVEAGELLAVIDREPMQVRLGEARARVAAAAASLRQA